MVREAVKLLSPLLGLVRRTDEAGRHKRPVQAVSFVRTARVEIHPEMLKALDVIGSIMVHTKLHCSMEVGNSAFGVAVQDGGSHF